MKAETTMPAAIRQRWKGWHAEEREWLIEFLEAMRTRYAEVARRVILFGSRARGDFREDSDIDVAVIIANEAADRKREIRRLGVRLSVESTRAMPSVAVRTEEEWARLASLESPWRNEVESQGVDAL